MCIIFWLFAKRKGKNVDLSQKKRMEWVTRLWDVVSEAYNSQILNGPLANFVSFTEWQARSAYFVQLDSISNLN